VKRIAHFVISLILSLCLKACTLAVEKPAAEWRTCRNSDYHFSFEVPPGWGVAEGYTMIYHYRSGLAALNSLGRDGFWVTQQRTGPSSWAYNPEIVLKQLPPGAVYFEVGLIEGPPRPPEYYGPEMEEEDLTPVRGKAEWEELVPGRLSRLELRFDKWGRAWSILAYLAEPVREGDRLALEGVLDSFRFDPIPTGDELWAIGMAKKGLPAAVSPERFPHRPSRIGAEGGWREAKAQRVNNDVLVTFIYGWGSWDVCHPESCHKWVFQVTASGEVIPIEEWGAMLPESAEPTATPAGPPSAR